MYIYFNFLRAINNKASHDLSHFVTKHISAVAMVTIGLQHSNAISGNL